jgi:23S rRNA (uracil1939-C5)-methyltransferase
MTLPFSVGDLLEVDIEKMAYGPSALARHQGFVFFVPFAAPGDRAQIRVTVLHKRHAEAEIVEVLQSSSARVPPACKVFGSCGGCDWQHLSYSQQIHWKQSLVSDFLKRSGATDFQLLPLQTTDQIWRYRHRVQLKIQEGKVGFFERGSHRIVDIDDCPLMESALQPALLRLRELAKAKPSADLRKVELQVLQDGKVRNSQDEDSPQGEGFSQVHRAQNEALIQTIIAWLKGPAWTQLYEFYAGSGNFTFPVLAAFPKAKVLAIEMHAGAVQKAQSRLRETHTSPKRCEFIAAPVEIALRRMRLEAASVVLLDPPRTGCEESVIRALAASAAQKILYLSCDPASLARDLQRLWTAQPGQWRLQRAQAFDLFPQTHHVETLVEIGRTLS